MKTKLLREVTLYRYRYFMGYVVFGVLLLALLLLAINQAPRGLSADEMVSAATSVNLNILKPTAVNVIDAPYHLLQKASIQYLGLTHIAVKLPSILLGAITGVAIVLMLQKWFRKNVAIITAILVVTSVGFLTLSRTGTPMIMTAFWTVLLLLGATHFLHAEKHRYAWKLFCFVSIAMLAYSPFGIYPLIAMVIAGIFHPHVRHRLKQGKWWQHTIAFALVVIVLAPLVVAIIQTPSVGLQLLGIDALNEFRLQQIMPTGITIIRQLFDFTDDYVGAVPTPLFGIATAVLLLLGILKLFTATYSARSYMIFIWAILLIPVLILHPDMILLVIVPATLVLAIGIETLIRQWYDLFPRNPYARIAALVPLSVLLLSITGINVERYFLGHHYNPNMSEFHPELSAVRNELDRRQLGTTKAVTISVPTTQIKFYDLLRREYPSVAVNGEPSTNSLPAIVLDDTPRQLKSTAPDQIVTSDLSQENQGVLLRSYSR